MPANRKTNMVSARLDTWMIEGIDILLSDNAANRTDWLKKIVSDALRREGITPAVVYQRRSERASEARTDDSDN